MERVTREAYRLRLPLAWRIHDVFHTSQLKAVAGQPKTEAPVILESGQEEFEVERILDMRVIRGQRQYLIKWKGYGDFENSWEPEGNLSNAKEVLQEFLGRVRRHSRGARASN